jgi:uncharacterized membrane protein YkvA (DUF1232 family)
LPSLRQHWVRSRTICRKWLAGLRCWAAELKRDVVALYSAARDPRVPWYAKVVALCIVAYAASPIDLIPDFVPILGYLDDLVILPLGIALAVRLIPAELLAEHRAAAEQTKGRQPAERPSPSSSASGRS